MHAQLNIVTAGLKLVEIKFLQIIARCRKVRFFRSAATFYATFVPPLKSDMVVHDVQEIGVLQYRMVNTRNTYGFLSRIATVIADGLLPKAWNAVK